MGTVTNIGDKLIEHDNYGSAFLDVDRDGVTVIMNGTTDVMIQLAYHMVDELSLSLECSIDEVLRQIKEYE